MSCMSSTEPTYAQPLLLLLNHCCFFVSNFVRVQASDEAPCAPHAGAQEEANPPKHPPLPSLPSQGSGDSRAQRPKHVPGTWDSVLSINYANRTTVRSPNRHTCPIHRPPARCVWCALKSCLGIRYTKGENIELKLAKT